MTADPVQKRVWPLWKYVLLIVSVSGSYVGHALIFDLRILAGGSEAIVPLQTGMWAALMTSFLCVLAHWTAHATEVRVFQMLGQLPFQEDKGGIDQIRADWLAFSAQGPHRRRRRIMLIGGVVSGLLFATIAIGMTIDVDTVMDRVISAGWFGIVLPPLFGYTSMHVYTNVVSNNFVMRAAVDATDIDILRPQRQIAFAQLALRNGLGWIVALTVTLLLTLGDQVSTVGMMPLILGAMALIILSFFGPMQIIHQKLVAVKAAELERLAPMIAAARNAVERGDDSAGNRLAGLISWRQAVADAKEWPTDAGTILRLFLYLAIPIGGWVGSAFVEALLEPFF